MKDTITKPLLILFLAVISSQTYSQTFDFPFGKITDSEMDMKVYPLDTSASAVILKEFGYSYINKDVHLVFQYHVKIKILKKPGIRKGDFTVNFYKSGNLADSEEKWRNLRAVTYNRESGKIVESRLDSSNYGIETVNKYIIRAQFSLPEVRVGSIIEVRYETDSPDLSEFHPWNFQDDIPKMYSEYRTSIPGAFHYSYALIGYLEFSRSETEEVLRCFTPKGNTGLSGIYSTCTLTKFVMENIPAFKEENYMLSRNNYLSSIKFELLEYIDEGEVMHPYAQRWEETDNRLLAHEYLGERVKEAKKIMKEIVTPKLKGVTDDLKKAEIIYNFFVRKYSWNGDREKYAVDEIKKTFDAGIGNAADINLALTGALQAARLDAWPILTSTRDNGLIFKEQPDETDFNYVIAGLKIGDKLYTLDATSPWIPFGILPFRCQNDQGRLLVNRKSNWVNIKSAEKKRKEIKIELAFDGNSIKGTAQIQSMGYDAIEKRQDISKEFNVKDYAREFEKSVSGISVSGYAIENQFDLTRPVIEKMNVELLNFNAKGPSYWLNPFIIDRLDANPFETGKRLIPVDFGTPTEFLYYVSLTVPEEFTIQDLPNSSSVALPNNGGKCLFNVTQQGNKVILVTVMSLTKTSYTPEEYPYIKEFFDGIVEIEQSLIGIKRK